MSDPIVARLRALTLRPGWSNQQCAAAIEEQYALASDLEALAKEMRVHADMHHTKAEQTANRLGNDDVAYRSMDYIAAWIDSVASRIAAPEPPKGE